jgi:transposase
MFKNGIEIKELSKEEVLKIPKLIEEKKSYKQIAIQFGVHETTIKNWVYKLRKIGYTIKTKRGKKGMLELLEVENK